MPFMADLAQLVEHRIRNARVGGSSPLVGTIFNQINEFAIKPGLAGLSIVLAISFDFLSYCFI